MADDENEDVVAQAGERLRGQVTVLLTVAGRAAEEYARHRRAILDEAARSAEGRAAQLRARYDAERAAARALLAATANPGWWAAAGPQQIADAWRTAVAWRDADERIAVDTARLAEELRRRYGVDPDQLAGSPPTSRAAATARVQERDDAALAAALVTREADADMVAGAGTEQPEWDSAAARARRTAAAKASGAGADAVQARTIGDVPQASPVTRAVAGGPPGTAARSRRRTRTSISTRLPDLGC